MKECVHGTGAFAGWTEERRGRLLSRLGTLINVRVRALIGVSVSTHAYAEAMQILGVDNPGPLSFAMVQSLHFVGAWCNQNGIRGESVGYWFEGGDRNAGEMTTVMNDVQSDPQRRAAYRCSEWGFGTKRLAPLQAADWLAYEINLHAQRVVLPQLGILDLPKRQRPMRRSLALLLKCPAKALRFFNTRDDVLSAAKYNAALPE
jgi:hypothetical protein